eukprot:CAMPEP_0197848270 /NCGR_PEP_ID=MMETSP1438-20131217/8112_1 /TAXON_ID=1461541 /ORGANISM="Pterosperma sp., Strain CCMP1384" /LENGTH=326 /DNA_ID=CAMNT_0043460427 /DNA_START=136 /DNA_END=1113 /DNA_ORIENTATION=-
MDGFSGFWNKVTSAAAEGSLLEKAKELAQEGSQLAQAAAQEGAKQAQEAAKRAQERAAEASKEAQIKAQQIADEIKEKGAGQVLVDNTAAAQESAQHSFKVLFARNEDSVEPPPTIEELTEYGITEEVLEFVRGLTVQTFRDFPSPAEEKPVKMTSWQENHCRLLLRVCDEVKEFRYVLVPRRMTDERFWVVYFTLMANQLEKQLQEAETAPAPQHDAQHPPACAPLAPPPEVSAAILEAVDTPISPNPGPNNDVSPPQDGPAEVAVHQEPTPASVDADSEPTLGSEPEAPTPETPETPEKVSVSPPKGDNTSGGEEARKGEKEEK